MPCMFSINLCFLTNCGPSIGQETEIGTEHTRHIEKQQGYNTFPGITMQERQNSGIRH